MIELVSALNSRGTKKISLKWNDETDTLYIQENEEIKPIRDDRFDDLMEIVDRPDPKPEVDMKTIDLLKEELEKMRYEVVTIREILKLIKFKVKKKPAPLTDFEKKVGYYHFLYTNDCGQGEGKLWPGMRYMPKGWVALRWASIVTHYASLGYDI